MAYQSIRLLRLALIGVGCAFEAQVKGDQVVRMIPHKAGKANRGHSCAKGRFAFGYSTQDRITKPMIRNKKSDEPWHQVDWDVALSTSKIKSIRERFGDNSVGGITSSRYTNEKPI